MKSLAGKLAYEVPADEHEYPAISFTKLTFFYGC
jgi:hypothetical protein